MKLHGRTIVLTRATHQFAEMALIIERLGGVAISFPTIAIHTAPPNLADRTVIQHLMAGAYTWVVFTSINAVNQLTPYAAQLHRIAAIHPQTRIAAIGEHTAQRIRNVFLRDVDFVASVPSAAHLFTELAHRQPDHVCWIRGNLAQSHHTPFQLDTITVYNTICATDGPTFASLPTFIHAIVFQSGSAVHNFVTRLHREQLDVTRLRTTCFAYHGATAYRVAHVLNLPRHFYCESIDSATFIDQLAVYLSQEQSNA